MKPTKDRLLVKVKEEKKVEGKKKQEVKGTSVLTADVIKVGPKVEGIQPKDVVVFAPYGIDEVVDGDDTFLIVPEDLVLAIK